MDAERRSSLEVATKLGTPKGPPRAPVPRVGWHEPEAGWVLGLYPDAGEVSGTFHCRSRNRRCSEPGPALDQGGQELDASLPALDPNLNVARWAREVAARSVRSDGVIVDANGVPVETGVPRVVESDVESGSAGRSRTEAERRARALVRRYAAANRLDRLGTLTYRGEGEHDQVAVRRHVAHFFKRLRYDVIEEPYPYLWVPEWHKTGHGLHVHFALDRYVKQTDLSEVWGRGFTHIKRLGSGQVRGSLASARRAAGYLSKYVSKSFTAHERSARLHRYEVAQGFRPKVVRITAPTRAAAIDQASEWMGRAPATLWSSEGREGWLGPPAVWAAWDD